MKERLIWNDWKANRLVTAAIICFMAVSAALTGLTVLLFGSLLTSIDRLMETAETPDFLQMHAGAVDRSILERFAASRDEVDRMQILVFLNLENGELSLGECTLADSTQDNGLCVQSEAFDYLVDQENRILRPAPGEVYVPVCYRGEYNVRVGDRMRIGTQALTVAGFLRDSQMNSMMASSKRFLVNEADYQRLKELGREEFLIEFKLRNGADINAFATAYEDAGLPHNGPTITRPLIRLMNALSDGMMILVILLASTVILIISILCIRCILLTSLEKDRHEIGMMKAIGIARRDIRSLYFNKFLILSAVGAVIGEAAALLISVPLGRQMKELYGLPEHMILIYLLSVAGTLAVEGMMLCSVHRTPRVTERMTAVEALYGTGRFGKKRNRSLFIAVITAAATALILIPQNTASTLASPRFVTYMGIGSSQIRIDVRQTEQIDAVVGTILEELENDPETESAVVMETRSCRVALEDGREYSLLIENGDHSRYPVSDSEGSWPSAEDEIALSILNASELGVGIGDRITVRLPQNGGEKEHDCRVCGLYSDITNGGKTAKSAFAHEDQAEPPMWCVIYVTLKEGSSTAEWAGQFQTRVHSLGAGIRVTDISQYVSAMYGQTILRIRKAAALAAAASCLVLAVVVLLFMRLTVWQERRDCSLKKALGFVSAEIRTEYLKRLLVYILAGVAAGIFTGLVPGQKLAGLLLGSLGASGFRFIPDPVRVFLLIPAVTITVALLAGRVSLNEVNRIRATECCVGRE